MVLSSYHTLHDPDMEIPSDKHYTVTLALAKKISDLVFVSWTNNTYKIPNRLSIQAFIDSNRYSLFYDCMGIRHRHKDQTHYYWFGQRYDLSALKQESYARTKKEFVNATGIIVCRFGRWRVETPTNICIESIIPSDTFSKIFGHEPVE